MTIQDIEDLEIMIRDYPRDLLGQPNGILLAHSLVESTIPMLIGELRGLKAELNRLAHIAREAAE